MGKDTPTGAEGRRNADGPAWNAQRGTTIEASPTAPSRRGVTTMPDHGRRCAWSPREREILSVTLRLLQQCGFDGVTVEAIAVAAHCSKATIYRRWPCKADLVVAAVVEGIPEISDPPDTGTLRGDLLHLGNILCDHVNRQSSTLRAVIGEAPHHPALNDALRRQLLDQRDGVVEHVLQRAVDRGEIDGAAITTELRDLLPGYLLYRSVVPNRPPTRQTVQALVEDALLPSLTRPTK
jgi:AcrR family transcriptional regulator